jgi:hypothetical protein
MFRVKKIFRTTLSDCVHKVYMCIRISKNRFGTSARENCEILHYNAIMPIFGVCFDYQYGWGGGCADDRPDILSLQE